MLNRHRRLLAYNNKERRSRPRSSRLALSSSKSADDCAGGSRSLRNPLLIKRLALSSSKSGHDCAGGSRSLRNPLLIKPSRAVIIEIRPRLCRRQSISAKSTPDQASRAVIIEIRPRLCRRQSISAKSTPDQTVSRCHHRNPPTIVPEAQ